MSVDVTVDIPIIRYMPYSTQLKPRVTANVSVLWTANFGSLSPTSGSTALFTPPNQTRTSRVTGTSSPDSDFVDIQVYATIPFQPHFGFEQDWDNKTLRSEAEDGSAVLRVKGPIKRSWQVSFNNLPPDEWILLREFFRWHQKHLPFYYQDLAVPDNVGSGEADILTLVTFDAGLKVTVAGPQRFNVATAFREQ
jgi:hypothetical protein